MKLIYIVAPYRATHPATLQQHIHEAKIMAQYYWIRGNAVICPHLNSANFDGIVRDQQFLNGTLLMLSKCDKAILHPEFRKSEGACTELIYCREHGIHAKLLTSYQFDEMRSFVRTYLKEKIS